MVPGYRFKPDRLAAELAIIVRRVDEATSSGAASLRAGEIENVAGAARALASSLPADQRQAPEVQDALASLMAAVGDVASTAHYQPSAEPTVTQPAIGDREQVQLARLLLGEAGATLDEVAGLPPGPDEHKQYAAAAAAAASKVQVAADLIAAHVPPGKARMALSGIVEGVSGRVAQVDQWVRASKVSSDASIASLYRGERGLRELVGLDAARRTPLETIDADMAAANLTAEPKKAAHGGTVAHVRAALTGVLQSMEDAIATFLAGADKGAKPPPSLTEELLNLAVETALGSSLEGAFKRAILATGRAIAGSEDEGELPGKLLDIAWRRGKDAIATTGQHVPSEKQLLKGYAELLRYRMRKSADAIRQGFEDQAESLDRVAPESLRAVADSMEARADMAGQESLLQYVLSWQTLKARASQGTPEQPRYDHPESRDMPSERDAALAPAFTAGIPGVLHVDFPLVPLMPRASTVRERSGDVADVTAAHLKVIKEAEPRPLRELHLNTSIRVTYGDSNGGGVEILWFPDGGTVKASWERMDYSKQSLGDARHLQAYARGLPVGHPSLEQATEADAQEGARLIAEAVANTPSDKAFGK